MRILVVLVMVPAHYILVKTVAVLFHVPDPIIQYLIRMRFKHGRIIDME